MKRGSTIFLKAVIDVIGLIAIALCVFVLPRALSSDVTGYYQPIIIGMYISAVPFFIAIYQVLKLLNYIDANKVFSDVAVKSLKYIKYCAFIISAIYAAGLPYIYYVADRDDAPGVVALSLVIVGASFVIATATAVFQGLLQNAIDIKSENDLTV